MARTAAATPEAYLAELSPERREAIATVRGTILIPLETVGRLIAAVPPDVLIAQHQARTG